MISEAPASEALRECTASSLAEAAVPDLSLAQTLVLSVLRGYKLVLSPLFAGSCRFLPSCSDYARQAVIEHGVLKGGWLALTRLSRCHPFGSSGFDPVPGRPPRI